MNHIQAGFAEKAISPEKGVSLCGYFNNRYNQGVHDELHVKAMVVSDGKRTGVLLLVGLPMEPFSEIGKEIKRRSPFPHTFALGILNGGEGYLGTREAAERIGGMETMPGVSCLRRFVPEAADLLTDAAAGLAASLAKDDPPGAASRCKTDY